MEKVRFAIIMTNFNNSFLTCQAIDSIIQSIEIVYNFEIIIIDNGSDKENIEILKSINSPYVEIIFNTTNVGYFAGLNQGLEMIKNRIQEFNAIIVGNNDLIFSFDFFYAIYSNDKLLDIFPVISPNIITLDGVYQNPHVINKISYFREKIYDLYYSHYLIAIIISLLSKITHKHTKRNDESYHYIGQTIQQGYGACYIISPLFFKYFTKLFAPTFLMGEEFFLSIQLESVNKKIYYEPSIIIQHYDHATVSNVPKKKFWDISKESHIVYKLYRSGKKSFAKESLY